MITVLLYNRFETIWMRENEKESGGAIYKSDAHVTPLQNKHTPRRYGAIVHSTLFLFGFVRRTFVLVLFAYEPNLWDFTTFPPSFRTPFLVLIVFNL